MTATMILASGAAAVAVAGLMWRLVPPTPRLAGRLRPYLAPTVSLRRDEEGSSVARVFGPMLERLATALGNRIDATATAALAVRLRQAGFHPEMSDDRRVASYRLRQVRVMAVWGLGATLVAMAVGLGTPGVVGLALAGGVAGVGRVRGRTERILERRANLMRIEIYTIDQLLALRVRAGGGVVQAVGQVVARGRGEVVRELSEALRLHRSGLTVGEAFARVAETSLDPACARTYRLLAIAEERGVDLAAGLLALAEDVRESRREALQRAATKRRAAMLVPTIALLAPTLLLFVAAPLPYLLTGWR